MKENKNNHSFPLRTIAKAKKTFKERNCFDLKKALTYRTHRPTDVEISPVSSATQEEMILEIIVVLICQTWVQLMRTLMCR